MHFIDVTFKQTKVKKCTKFTPCNFESIYTIPKWLSFFFCEHFRLKGTTKGSKDMAKAFNALEMMDTLHEQGMRAFVVSNYE